jgi:hypothetical protein
VCLEVERRLAKLQKSFLNVQAMFAEVSRKWQGCPNNPKVLAECQKLIAQKIEDEAWDNRMSQEEFATQYGEWSSKLLT